MPWDEFLRQVRRYQSELRGDDPLAPIWYRGQRQSEWPLQPSLFRGSGSSEKQIYRDFIRHAARVGPQRGDAWETLFDMQHHFLPTRLLDWTETFGVALFFAIQSEPPREAAIYLLQPQRLNRERDVWTPADLGLDYMKHYVLAPVGDDETVPIAVEAPFQNDRMFAQRSVFTVHRRTDKPHDQWNDAVRRVPLPADAFAEAKVFLGDANITAFTLFPDVAGFARFMRRKVNLPDDPMPFV